MRRGSISVDAKLWSKSWRRTFFWHWCYPQSCRKELRWMVASQVRQWWNVLVVAIITEMVYTQCLNTHMTTWHWNLPKFQAPDSTLLQQIAQRSTLNTLLKYTWAPDLPQNTLRLTLGDRYLRGCHIYMVFKLENDWLFLLLGQSFENWVIKR